MSKRIKQGNVSPVWRVGVQAFNADGEAITGQLINIATDYTCTLAVPTAVPPIERVVTRKSSDDLRFLAQLTPDETTTMPVGNHKIVIEVENTLLTPPFRVEAHEELIIDCEYITA